MDSHVAHFIKNRPVGRAPRPENRQGRLDRIVLESRSTPKHLIVDQGREFKCDHFENRWSPQRNTLPRFGAVGRHGSIAVVERLNRTAKELLCRIVLPEDSRCARPV